MNISKAEQRVLHVLAQGGMIRHRRSEDGHIVEALCFTRDGFVLASTGLPLFNRLRRRGFIGSHGGAPYRITQSGLRAVRAQLDNR
ncbi:MAG TPA: YjhX family toxin [Sphingopyxis sp.]|nr:YjhX family toxin [Sphingopyxis sp.]